MNHWVVKLACLLTLFLLHAHAQCLLGAPTSLEIAYCAGNQTVTASSVRAGTVSNIDLASLLLFSSASLNATSITLNNTIGVPSNNTVSASGTSTVVYNASAAWPPSGTLGPITDYVGTGPSYIGLSACAACQGNSQVDGVVNISASVSGSLHAFWPGIGNATAGGTCINIGAIRTDAGAGAGLSPPAMSNGQTVVIMQMQGVNVYWDPTNPTLTGDGKAINGSDPTADAFSGSGFYTDLGTRIAGNYEYVRVSNYTANGGGFIMCFQTPLINTYVQRNATSIGGNIYQTAATWQVIRGIQASNLSISNILDTTPWNGATGGVMVLDVANTLTFASNTARFTALGRGFRGGGGQTLDPNHVDCGNNQNNDVTGRDPAKRSPGEGIAGTPFYTYDSVGNTIVQNSNTYPKTWRGYIAGLGSGPAGSGATSPFVPASGRPWWSCVTGTNGLTCTCNNDNRQYDTGSIIGSYYEPRIPDVGENITQVTRNRISFGNAGGYGTVYDAGGGGGSYVGVGGQGGSRLDVSVTGTCTQNCCFNGGLPGGTYVPDPTHFIMGGGGGSFGDDNEALPTLAASSGAAGGGIIMTRISMIVKTGAVTLPILFTADGAAVNNASTACAGSSYCTEGRGGGGAGGTVSFYVGTIASNVNITITANGGTGGSVQEPNDGGGGGGGGGYINIASYSTIPTGQITATANGGARGTGGTNNTAVACTNVGGQDGSSSGTGNGTITQLAGVRCCNMTITLKVPVLTFVSAVNDSTTIYKWTYGPQPGYPVNVTTNDFWGLGAGGTCTGNFNMSVGTVPPGWTVNVTTTPCSITIYPALNNTGTYTIPYTICDTRIPALCSTAYVTVSSIPPELQVQKSYRSTGSTPQIGGTLIYDVVITNTGVSTFNNIAVNDSITAGNCSIASMTPNNGSVSVSFSPTLGTWTISGLGGGASVLLTITCTSTSTGVVTNQACITGSVPAAGGVSSNACSSASSPSVGCLSITKTGNDSSLALPDVELFTVSVTNNCACELYNVTVSDSIPSQLSYVASSFSGSYQQVTAQAWNEPFQTTSSNTSYKTGNWPNRWTKYGDSSTAFNTGNVRVELDFTGGGNSLRTTGNTRGVINGPFNMTMLCQNNTLTVSHRQRIHTNDGALTFQFSSTGSGGPWTTIATVPGVGGGAPVVYTTVTFAWQLPVSSTSNGYIRIFANDAGNNDSWYFRNVFVGSFTVVTTAAASPGSFTPLPSVAILDAGGTYNFTMRATRTGVPSVSPVVNTASATATQCGTFVFSPPSTTTSVNYACGGSNNANYTASASFPMTLTETPDCRCNNTAGETAVTAPYDCSPCNNDTICANTENPQTCPHDCPVGVPCNNNGRCDSNENFASCPNDCNCTCNGNGYCDLKENAPCIDCEGGPCEPNGRCDLNENFSNCPQDCRPCVTDCMCATYEREWCTPDCVAVGACDNDGRCDANENAAVCSVNSCDCLPGFCNNNGACEPTESDACPDCRSTCCTPNTRCEVGENTHNCSADCDQTDSLNGMCQRGETQVTKDCGTCT